MSPLFGSTLVTALAQSSFTTTSGLSIPGVLARIFHELEDKGMINNNNFFNKKIFI